MFIALTLSIVGVAAATMVTHRSPDSEVSGLIITIVSASVMGTLWLVKRRGATILNSVSDPEAG